MTVQRTTASRAARRARAGVCAARIGERRWTQEFFCASAPKRSPALGLFDYVSRLSWQIRFLPDLVTRNARAAASAPRCGGAAAARAAVLHAASAHDRCADVHVLVHCWSFVASCSACMCTRCTIVDHHRELQRSRHRRAESRRTGPCASGAGALLRARSRRPRCRPGAAAAEAANVSPPPPPSRPPPAPT